MDENSKKSTSASETDDMLWEYDGNTYDGECEEIMLEMQRIFYEDPRTEPTSREPESLDEDEDEYLARAVYEHMQLSDEKVSKMETWCPICKQGELKQNNDVIYCVLCKLQLSKGKEVSLDFLRCRLAEAHMDHLDQGCKLKPKFSVETKFGFTALYITCLDCGMYEVII